MSTQLSKGSVDDGESGTAAAAAPPAAASGQLIDEESAHVGSVRWTVYLDYIRSLGFLISAFVVILYIVSQGSFNRFVTLNVSHKKL